MIVVKRETHYRFVTDKTHATTNYPDLCTYTVDGEFGYVFCNTENCDEVVRFINEQNTGTIEHIRFS